MEQTLKKPAEEQITKKMNQEQKGPINRQPFKFDISYIIRCEQFEPRPYVTMTFCSKCIHYGGKRIVTPQTPQMPEISQVACKLPRYKTVEFMATEQSRIIKPLTEVK